jgi:hypothetical protein
MPEAFLVAFLNLQRHGDGVAGRELRPILGFDQLGGDVFDAVHGMLVAF